MSPYTHKCSSKDATGTDVSLRHISETQAILDQIIRERAGHSNVIVMPLSSDELAEYPQPDDNTATKHRNDTRAQVKP